MLHLNWNVHLYLDEHILVITPFAVADVNTQNDGSGYFATGDTSASWELNNVCLRAKAIQLDNTVNNNIVTHLQRVKVEICIPYASQYDSIIQCGRNLKKYEYC